MKGKERLMRHLRVCSFPSPHSFFGTDSPPDIRLYGNTRKFARGGTTSYVGRSECTGLCVLIDRADLTTYYLGCVCLIFASKLIMIISGVVRTFSICLFFHLKHLTAQPFSCCRIASAGSLKDMRALQQVRLRGEQSNRKTTTLA